MRVLTIQSLSLLCFLGGLFVAHESTAWSIDGENDQIMDPIGSEGDEKGSSSRTDRPSRRFLAGLKGSYLAAFSDDSVDHYGGGGVFFGVLVVPNWLELELSARTAVGRERAMFPIDLLFKVPFHHVANIHPYIGIGPSFVSGIVQEQGGRVTANYFGGCVSAGSYFWVSPAFGVVVEFNYRLIFEDVRVNSVGASVGVATGW